jgi:hypothetical protein
VSYADYISHSYPSFSLIIYLGNIVCYDMSDIPEIETLQLQIEELRTQLNALRLGATVSVPNRQTKDVSLVTGIQD